MATPEDEKALAPRTLSREQGLEAPAGLAGDEQGRTRPELDLSEHRGLLRLGAMTDQEFEQGLAMLQVMDKRIARMFNEALVRGEMDDADLMVRNDIPRPFLTQNGATKIRQLMNLTTEDEYVRANWGNGDTEPVLSVEAKVAFFVRGERVGSAIGFASSWEPKHRYVNVQAACPKCKLELRRGTSFQDRSKKTLGCWKSKGGCGFEATEGTDLYKDLAARGGQEENPDQGGLVQILSMMALKRARVAGTRNISGISRYTTQDEDMVHHSDRAEKLVRQPEENPERKAPDYEPRPTPKIERPTKSAGPAPESLGLVPELRSLLRDRRLDPKLVKGILDEVGNKPTAAALTVAIHTARRAIAEAEAKLRAAEELKQRPLAPPAAAVPENDSDLPFNSSRRGSDVG